MNRWNPIESCLRDGTKLLLFGRRHSGKGCTWVGSIEDVEGEEYLWVETTYSIDENSAIAPTHWMLLPEEPR